MVDKIPTKAFLEREKLALEVWKMGREKALVENGPIAKGEFTYVGPVIEEMVHDMITQLDNWSRNHPSKPISIVINSQGGVVIDGFALYDFIQEIRRRGHHV